MSGISPDWPVFSEWDISAMPFRRRRSGDAVRAMDISAMDVSAMDVSAMDVSAMDVSAMDFRSTLLLPNFRTYPQCQSCSIVLGKFIMLVFTAKVAKKTCQTSKEKAYLAFDCKYVSCSLPSSKLWHPAPPNVFTRSPRGNLWHPAVGTGARFRRKKYYTCPQDDNKNAHQANTLSSVTTEVFQKHTFFPYKKSATTITEMFRRRNGIAEMS